MRRTALKSDCLTAALCAAALLTGCGMPLQDQPLPDDPYGWNGSGKTVNLIDLGENTELREGHARMSRGEVYFSALHVDPASARFAYARGWNALEAAIAVSAAVCAESAGRDCKLAAIVLPVFMPNETRRAEGFSVMDLHRFRWIYYRAQKPGLWGAFAISPLSASGLSAQAPSEQTARARALEECRARLEWELGEIGPTGAAAARRGGFVRCEVVHLSRP